MRRGGRDPAAAALQREREKERKGSGVFRWLVVQRERRKEGKNGCWLTEVRV